MRITDIQGLYVGYSQTENFRILIAAEDADEAKQLAEEYFDDARIMYDSVQISEFDNVDTHFDCDYIIKKS